jgi:predicted MFS family arabinose efflux permease
MADGGTGYGEFRRGWPIVLSAMLGIGLGLSPVPFYTIGIFAPELARTFHWGFGQVMGGLPITTLAVLVASPLVGLLADRFGVRRVALVSVALFGASFMAFAASNGSLVLFYINWGVMAFIGAGTLPITWTRAVNNAFDVRKGFALGLSLLGTGLFGYLVKPFAAAIMAAWGWRVAYVAIGALPLLVALPVAFFGFHDVDARGNVVDRKAAQAERRAATPGLTFAQAIRHWRFWVLALAFLPISFAVGGPIPNMENILKLAGFTPDKIVTLASLIGLSVIGGRVIGGWLIDRIWAPAVALALIGAPAAACWLLAHGPLTYGICALSIIMIGFAAGVEYDLMAFLVARYFGMKSYAAIYGALYGFFAAGAGVAPVVFGQAFDRTHSYAQPLILSAGMLLAGALLLLTLGRYRRFDGPSIRGAVAPRPV